MRINTKLVILMLVSAVCFIACGICYRKYVESKEVHPLLHFMIFLTMMAALTTMAAFMWLGLTRLGRYRVF